MHAFTFQARSRRARPASRLWTIGHVLLVLLGLMLWPGAAAAGVPHERAVAHGHHG